MVPNPFLDRLGITHPIFLAPMGGGTSTPELVAAVSNAGGLGSLGAPYLTPSQIGEAIARIRALTDKPFTVNLFAGAWAMPEFGDTDPMLAFLGAAHAALELPPPALLAVPPDPFAAQFRAVLEARPPGFSFTFGIPDAAALAELRARGIVVSGTATTVEEGQILATRGVDAVIAQGEEAGAHRGTFAGPFEAAMVPTLDLVSSLAAAIPLPVIAAGGLMTGADIAAALSRGATAASLGTAFMTCPEAGTPAIHKQAILGARSDTTVITRAFSGRPARGIANFFITDVASRNLPIPPYPLQNLLTRAMRSEAGRRGRADYLSLWAGRGLARARSMPAGELVHVLAKELAAASGG